MARPYSRIGISKRQQQHLARVRRQQIADSGLPECPRCGGPQMTSSDGEVHCRETWCQLKGMILADRVMQ